MGDLLHDKKQKVFGGMVGIDLIIKKLKLFKDLGNNTFFLNLNDEVPFNFLNLRNDEVPFKT